MDIIHNVDGNVRRHHVVVAPQSAAAHQAQMAEIAPLMRWHQVLVWRRKRNRVQLGMNLESVVSIDSFDAEKLQFGASSSAARDEGHVGESMRQLAQDI